MVKRLLDLNQSIGQFHSTFLFGARGVGKTWLVRDALEHRPDTMTLTYDLLLFEEYSRLVRSMRAWREEIEEAIKSSPDRPIIVFIDEIQRVPQMLDEIQNLISRYHKRVQFILSGSSARKLKRHGANLLAGRALSLHLHPLLQREFSMPIETKLLYGSLPGIVCGNDKPKQSLKSYVQTYLKEEVFQEALVRKLDAFSRFLEVAAQYHTRIPNLQDLSKASGVSAPTISEYLKILEDTLIAFQLPGWNASARKQLRTSPKFYFFDNGVANALRGELSTEVRESSSRFGDLFEAMVVQEAYRLRDYLDLEIKFSHWRTNNGLEVDLVVSRGAGNPLAGIEIKSCTEVEDKHLTGLRAFAQDWPAARCQCWARVRRRSTRDQIEIIPWEEGLDNLASF